VKNYKAQIDQKSTKFAENAANYRNKFENRSTEVRANINDKAEAVRTELNAKSEMLKENVESLKSQAIGLAGDAKVRAGSYIRFINLKYETEYLRIHIFI